MPEPGSIPLAPKSSVLAQATTTAPVSLAIPARTRVIEVVGATVKHFIKLGESATPGTVNATTSAIVQIGGVATFSPHYQHTHLHVAAASATGTVDISYWG